MWCIIWIYYLTYLSPWPRPFVTNTTRTRIASQTHTNIYSECLVIGLHTYTRSHISHLYCSWFLQCNNDFAVVKYTVYKLSTTGSCVCVCAKTNHCTSISQRQRVECNKSRGVPNIAHNCAVHSRSTSWSPWPEWRLLLRNNTHTLNNDGHNNGRSEIIRDLARRDLRPIVCVRMIAQPVALNVVHLAKCSTVHDSGRVSNMIACK